MKVYSSFSRVLFISLISLLTAWAQDGPKETDPSKLDPSDIYFQAWMALRDADEFQEAEDYQKAFEATTRSKRLLDTVTLYHPQWKPHLVERKQNEASPRLETLANLLPKEPSGALKLYQGEEARKRKPVAPGLTAAEILQANRIQRELAETKEKLSKLENQRTAEVASLNRRIKELTAERDELANSTLKEEVQELKNRIDLVEDEKRILARKLAETRTELEQAQGRITNLDLKEKESRKVANQLNAMLQKERGVSGDVITGLRNKQENLVRELKETKKLLLVERQQTQRLERLLADSRNEVELLTTERNHLLKERDHLAELLQLNQGDRIQRLIEQNMTLARNLREAEDTMNNLSKNVDAKANELSNAKRDISLAKAKIIAQREESDAEIQRRQTLERKLADAYEELKAREELSDLDSDLVDENRVLREVADKLLRTQKRRREQAALIVKAAREKEDDPDTSEAIQQLFGQELVLTADEQEMVNSNRSIDGSITLVGVDKNTPEQVRLSNAELRRYTKVVDGLIENAFARGKTEVALDLSEELIEQNPGYYPAMLDQGVILLKMGLPEAAIDSFNNAMTLRVGALPYANYMKGVAHHSLSQFDRAQKEYEVAVQLDPSNADAFNRLGSLHAVAGREGQAREKFEMAYRLDDTHLEPLINLSVLHQNMGEAKAALNYYRKFRKAGGQPRPELEKLLAKANQENDEKKDLEANPNPPASVATPVISR